MTTLIITSSGLLITVIALVIALISKKNEVEKLQDDYNKLQSEKYWRPRYEILRKFVVVNNDQLRAFTQQEIQQAEAEGYKYDVQESFPTILCFKKYLPCKDEEDQPSES